MKKKGQLAGTLAPLFYFKLEISDFKKDAWRLGCFAPLRWKIRVNSWNSCKAASDAFLRLGSE